MAKVYCGFQDFQISVSCDYYSIIHPSLAETYYSSRNDIVKTTTNTSLNGKLFAKLLISLEGSALQSIVSQPHLCANGLLVLQDLFQTH
jgi:hypothetical protein